MCRRMLSSTEFVTCNNESNKTLQVGELGLNFLLRDQSVARGKKLGRLSGAIRVTRS